MARIAGINIPQNKVVHVALTYIHGIGNKFSQEICTKLSISKNKRVNSLTLLLQFFFQLYSYNYFLIGVNFFPAIAIAFPFRVLALQ